jgi:hypothetical protein
MSDAQLLDARQRSEVCAVVTAGGSQRVAAWYVGCSPAAIRRAALCDPTFAHELQAARARHQILHLRQLSDALRAKPDWRGLAWVLERCHTEEFGVRKAGALSSEKLSEVVEELAAIVLEEVADEEARYRMLARIEELLEGQPSEAARGGKAPGARQGAGERKTKRQADPLLRDRSLLPCSLSGDADLKSEI